MTGKITWKRELQEDGTFHHRKVCLLDGEEVTEAEFEKHFPDREIQPGTKIGGPHSRGWPLKSQALGVHPDQIEEATARNKHHGVNVRYDRTGAAIVPDNGERRKILKLERLVDKDSFY